MNTENGKVLDGAKMLEFQIQTKLAEFSKSGDGAQPSWVLERKTHALIDTSTRSS